MNIRSFKQKIQAFWNKKFRFPTILGTFGFPKYGFDIFGRVKCAQFT